MEHKIILKCRICLDDFDEAKMIDLFKEKKSSRLHGAPLKLCENVEFCCGVRIRESTEMPSKICIKCFDMTRIWYNFRQLCINSQVYLESLCRDRCRPKGADDSEYLEYLFEDLQSFRHETRKENSEYDLKLEDSISEDDNENGEDTNDKFYETVPISAAESDAELQAIIQNIKKEQEEQEKENSNQTSIRRRKLKNKQIRSAKASSSSFVPKKRGRPPSPNSYMCSICGNVYTKKASFTYHMNLHSDVKPHECELCGKKFRQTCELKNHMRRHTGERPYKCTFCDRSFIDRSEKHRHERVHTNTRPYVCNVCGKSFMYSAILKNHKKLHSGEKEFNCLVCQKAFTLQHQLKAHLQTITHKQKEAQFVGAGYEVVYE